MKKIQKKLKNKKFGGLDDLMSQFINRSKKARRGRAGPAVFSLIRTPSHTHLPLVYVGIYSLGLN